MNSKSTIKFNLRVVPENEIAEFGGMYFSNIAYIEVFVNEINLLSLNSFQGSFLVFKELKESTVKSGEYLLFTASTGISDEAGWDYFKVLYIGDWVKWTIKRDEVLISYVFDKFEYLNEVSELEEKIKSLKKDIKLEPSYLIYPE